MYGISGAMLRSLESTVMVSPDSFSVLPTNWAGIGLVVLGAALLLIDLHATTHGALTIGGLICLGVGLPLLFSNAPPPYHVNTSLVFAVGLAIASVWAFITGKGIAARRRPVEIGPQAIVGREGEMRGRDFVLVGGELWHAHSTDGRTLKSGDEVRIDALDGLELTVTPLNT